MDNLIDSEIISKRWKPFVISNPQYQISVYQKNLNLLELTKSKYMYWRGLCIRIKYNTVFLRSHYILLSGDSFYFAIGKVLLTG